MKVARHQWGKWVFGAGVGIPDASQPGLEKAGETMKEKLSSSAEQKGSLRWRQRQHWKQSGVLPIWWINSPCKKKKMVREQSDRSLSQDANFVHIPHGSAFIPTPAVAERDVSYFLLFASL